MSLPIDPVPDHVAEKFSVQSATEGLRQAQPGFGAMMEGKAMPTQPMAAAGTMGPSPMDVTRTPGIHTGTPTFNSLLAQTNSMQDGLAKANDQLNYPNIKLNKPQSQLLKRHLQDASEHINKAAERVGVDGSPPTGKGTLANFLTWIGSGQDTLLSVQDNLQKLSKNPDSLNPADMMLVQVKMNQASNEIQFSTTLLGKVIDSIKQILSTQL